MGKARDEEVICRFCGGQGGDGPSFVRPYLSPSPWFMLGNSLKSCPLMARDRGNWLQCLLWHGWLPGLSSGGERDPFGCFSRSVG